MPRRPKGPRLYCRKGRIDNKTGQLLPDIWYIRDGSVERSTGCSADRLPEAEQALAEYLGQKWTPPDSEPGPGRRRPRDPADVFVAEVVALYLNERAPKLASSEGIGFRSRDILAFWGEKTLADVDRKTCEAYVAHRTSQPLKQAKTDEAKLKRVSTEAARRELEDLSAMIGYYAEERPLTYRPKVTLPPKRESPRDALTRTQAARLLKASLGWRLDEKGRWTRLQDSSVANRAHLRRFLLIGFYTGTRPGLIPRILWAESPTSPWVDLERGVIYRRGRDERESRTKRKPLVRVPDRLLSHLRRWREMDRKEQARRAEEAQEEGREPVPITSVIHHGGRPLAGRIRTGFESVAADARLELPATPHWMRHTCCTWLMEAGVDPWDAAGYAGMTSQTLEKHYGHHRPDHQDKARRALGRRK